MSSLVLRASSQHNMLPLIIDLSHEGQFPLASFELGIEALKADELFDGTENRNVYSLEGLLM